jgi:hypothetical protein
MGSGIICNTWQTCLRPVWARRGPCLHLADRLSRGKHLGISSIGVLTVSRGTKDKKPGKRRCCWYDLAQNKFTLLQLLPLVVSLAFLIPSSPPFAFDCSFPTRHLAFYYNIQASSKHHCDQPAVTSPCLLQQSSSSIIVAGTKDQYNRNVLPQVHALPQVRHARPAPHPHVSEERDRGHLAGYLLRELQSRPRQRQRSLSVLLARGQRQGRRRCSPGSFDKSSSVSQPGKHRHSIGCLEEGRPILSSSWPCGSQAVDVQLSPPGGLGFSVQRSRQPHIDPTSSFEAAKQAEKELCIRGPSFTLQDANVTVLDRSKRTSIPFSLSHYTQHRLNSSFHARHIPISLVLSKFEPTDSTSTSSLGPYDPSTHH